MIDGETAAEAVASELEMVEEAAKKDRSTVMNEKKPQIKAPRVTPLEGVSAFVCG